MQKFEVNLLEGLKKLLTSSLYKSLKWSRHETDSGTYRGGPSQENFQKLFKNKFAKELKPKWLFKKHI